MTYEIKNTNVENVVCVSTYNFADTVFMIANMYTRGYKILVSDAAITFPAKHGNTHITYFEESGKKCCGGKCSTKVEEKVETPIETVTEVVEETVQEETEVETLDWSVVEALVEAEDKEGLDEYAAKFGHKLDRRKSLKAMVDRLKKLIS